MGSPIERCVKDTYNITVIAFRKQLVIVHGDCIVKKSHNVFTTGYWLPSQRTNEIIFKILMLT